MVLFIDDALKQHSFGSSLVKVALMIRIIIRWFDMAVAVAVAVTHVMHYQYLLSPIILRFTFKLCFTFSLAFVQDQYHEGFPHPR